MADSKIDYEHITPSNVYTRTLDANIEAAWAVVKDYGTWGNWTPMFAGCKIIGDGVDKIGCIREFAPPTIGETYQETLMTRDEASHTLKYEISSILPPKVGLTTVFIHISLVPVNDKQCQISETAWNILNDKAPEGLAAELKAIQNKGATRTYSDLESYLIKQSYPNLPPSNVYTRTLDANIEAAWAVVKDYGTWGNWTPMFAGCKIIGDGIDKIGCIREFAPPTIGETYQETLMTRDEASHTLKYEISSILPAKVGLTTVFIHISLVPVSESQCQISETAWNILNDKAPEGLYAELKNIQNKGATRTYSDLENYLVQSRKQQAEENN